MNNTNLRLSIHPPESNLWIQWCLGTYHLSVGSQEMIWTLGGQFHNVPLIFGSNEFVPKYAHSKAHLLFALPEMGLWSYKERFGRFNQHLVFSVLWATEAFWNSIAECRRIASNRRQKASVACKSSTLSYRNLSNSRMASALSHAVRLHIYNFAASMHECKLLWSVHRCSQIWI